MFDPRIVALGGGTGLSTMLRGLKKYTNEITAVITMADDGGGSGILRQDLGMLPPGDIRNCLLALAEIEPTLEKLFRYRFGDGMLKGQSLGNLILAAMNGIYGSFDEAIKHAHEVFAVTGKVLPVTCDDIRMYAVFEDGSAVFGESKIAEAKIKHGCKIQSVGLSAPHVMPAQGVLPAIENADMIILGPGSLYTSIIPNLLVDRVSDAIRKSNARKVYVCNVMTQVGETEGYSAFDHVSAIIQHGGEGLIDTCIVNTGAIAGEILDRYESLEGAQPVLIDDEAFAEAGITLVKAEIARVENDLARHNPQRLAHEIMKLKPDTQRASS